ncbi:MAG: hypothetical protein FWH41_03125 [Treponema sp.]|nr:hypothetical protein [Treponema sp.]
MKKAVLIFLIFASIKIYAQNSSQYQLGSAKILKGNIYVLQCFVSDYNNKWTQEEKNEASSKLYAAQNWLQKQASNYGTTVNFQGGSFGFAEDIKLEYVNYGTGSGREDINVLTTVFKKIGYVKNLDFYDWVQNNTNCENALVVIYVKGEGRSYSIAYESEFMDKEKYFTETCVVYNKYWGGLEMYEASIAHEMLHLFGAWDLYETFQQSREKEQRARQYFPNSIMLRTSYNINELMVDELTAWLIGWNNTAQGWYEWFKP